MHPRKGCVRTARRSPRSATGSSGSSSRSRSPFCFFCSRQPPVILSRHRRERKPPSSGSLHLRSVPDLDLDVHPPPVRLLHGGGDRALGAALSGARLQAPRGFSAAVLVRANDAATPQINRSTCTECVAPSQACAVRGRARSPRSLRGRATSRTAPLPLRTPLRSGAPPPRNGPRPPSGGRWHGPCKRAAR